MKRIVLALLLSLITVYSYGQGGRLIYGCVQDNQKKPLSGATISTIEGDMVCTTDRDGQFNIMYPEYITDILVSYDGYQTARIQLDGSFQIIRLRLNSQNKALAKLAKREARADASIKNKLLRNSEFEVILEKIKGWQNSIAVAIDGAGSILRQPSISVEYIGGKRLSNTLFAGFGAGLSYNTADNTLKPLSVPLYANMKVYLTRSKYQPYVFLSTGARLSTNVLYFNTSQCFVTTGVGFDIRLKSADAVYLQAGLQTITIPTFSCEYLGSYDVRYICAHKMNFGYYFQIGYNF